MNDAAQSFNQLALVRGMLETEEHDCNFGARDAGLGHRLSGGLFRRPLGRNVSRLSNAGSKHLVLTIGTLKKRVQERALDDYMTRVALPYALSGCSTTNRSAETMKPKPWAYEC